MTSIRVGVDAGGTFTDFVATGPGWQRMLKLPSRPDDPGALVLEALSRLIPGYESSLAIQLVFSTTAATNALLERKGGPTLLLTTAGFEDVLEIARQTRPELYALEPVLPRPLVAAEDRLGVAERIDAGGEVVLALKEEELDRVVAALRQRDPSARSTVAICLLHCYAEPAHEQLLARRLRAAGWRASVSSEVCPLPREYERSSTTVIDAYVTPALGQTLLALIADELTLRVMESAGGARTARQGVVARPARTVLSGPAAGVIAVERMCQRLGLSVALALDIGGTSTDVALIRKGRAARVDELSIDGLPIALPSIAVRTVGAGGGSIAWLDGGGALKVGPRLAGAVPGPAAYGHGGLEPTLTDAQLVLERLGSSICGGEIPLEYESAWAAVGMIAAPLGVSIEEAALAIVSVADAAIARAARTASLGEQPQALIAYGGASGLHAVAVARALGIEQVIVPVAPGLQCAIGALSADVVIDEIAAWGRPLDARFLEDARTEMDMLAAAADEALAADGVPDPLRSIARHVRARYAGQGIDGELELPFDALLDRAAFDRAHEAEYGHRLDRDVEVVSLRVRGVGCVEAPTIPPDHAIGWARVGTRASAPIYARDRLRPGRTIVGPAFIEELSATLYLPEGASAICHPEGALMIKP